MEVLPLYTVARGGPFCAPPRRSGGEGRDTQPKGTISPRGRRARTGPARLSHARGSRGMTEIFVCADLHQAS